MLFGGSAIGALLPRFASLFYDDKWLRPLPAGPGAGEPEVFSILAGPGPRSEESQSLAWQLFAFQSVFRKNRKWRSYRQTWLPAPRRGCYTICTAPHFVCLAIHSFAQWMCIKCLLWVRQCPGLGRCRNEVDRFGCCPWETCNVVERWKLNS